MPKITDFRPNAVASHRSSVARRLPRVAAALLAVCALPALAGPSPQAQSVQAVHSVAVKPVQAVHSVAVKPVQTVTHAAAASRVVKADTPQAAPPNAAVVESPFRPVLHYQTLWNGGEHVFYIRVEDADHRMIVFKIADSHEFSMVQTILASPGGAQTDGRSISSNLMDTPSK